MFNDDIYPASKDYLPQSLYVRQPCSLQIIQLVECSPPPPQQKYTPSRISSSSYSDSQSDDSACDSSSPSLSDGSSYCSSVEGSAAPVRPSLNDRDPSFDDTYRTRQRRVSLWRDAVCSKNDAASARPPSPSQKRKTPDGDLRDSDAITSHTPRKSPRSTLSAHSCPACDEDFSSPLSLRQHASTSKNVNEACRIAVEYGFE
ncbi:hypothetical protein BJV78DRAFT_1350118 [Lactifluus subvellereus]|nr:hypothetical protein BJV78DRAFT_1350118 [Lactifluus subvellereus]